LNAALSRVAWSTHGKNQSNPAPLKISWYTPHGALPVEMTMTRPPRRNAMIAVRTGASSPLACCASE
jgi:hypothetical protein